MPIDIPSSRVPHKSTLSGSSNDYLLSCTPNSASDENTEGHMVLPQKSLDIKKAATYLTVKHSVTAPESSNQTSSSLETAHDSHSSSVVSQEPDDCGANKAPVVPAHNMNEETLQCHTDLSTTARTQEQENQLRDPSTMDTHLLVEICNDDFVSVSYMKPDNGHYRKLAEFMKSVCNRLVTVNIPDYTTKINHIKQILESIIKIYNNESEESMEKANKDVQLQYNELKDMLENLPLSEPRLLSMYIDGILNGMQFYSIVGPYSPYNLVQAIRRTNRSTISAAHSRSRCSIM